MATPGGERCDAGLQESELGEIPPVERQVDQFTPCDDAAERVAGGLDERRTAGDADGLRDRRELELCVHANGLPDADGHRLAHQRREATGLNGDAVLAHGQLEHAKEPVRRGLHVPHKAGLAIEDDHLGAPDRARRLVADHAVDRPGRILGGGDTRHRERDDHRPHEHPDTVRQHWRMNLAS